MMFHRLWRALSFLFLVAAASAAFMAAAWAQQPVPALSGRVIDSTGTLSAPQVQALADRLAAFEQRKGSQIVVLMVAGTAPEDIAAYASRVAGTWKIGRREVGDGVLVIVAKDERRMRIEVAKTLEGAVPDLAAARIIDQQMKPAFRNGDFAGGLSAAVDQLIARIDGEALAQVAPPQADRGLMGVDWENLLLFFFFGVMVGAPLLRGLLGAKLGSLAAGGLGGALAYLFTTSVLVAVIAGVLALVFAFLSSALRFGGGGRHAGAGGWGGGYPGGGWGGGSSSSSDSGGEFSSGGGGDFGGGGASGDW